MSIIEKGIKTLRLAQGDESQPRKEPAFGVVRELHGPAAASLPASASSRRTVHVDRTALVEAGFLPPDQKQVQIGSQFRHVKRPLLAAALGRGREALPEGRMIMLTSSFPGEGKTFVSINLALSMSFERDISVVLVDADVAKPHVSRLFGIDSEPGLLEAIQDEDLDIDALILPTDIPNLSILPAGRPTDMATELLTSLRMEAVLAKLSGWQDRKRILIFDSPPLLLTSESRVLAQHMGQIVLVVRAGVTQQHAVFDAINCLGDQRPVSLLLNQSETASEKGYSYRDGPYGGYGRESRAKDPAEAAGHAP